MHLPPGLREHKNIAESSRVPLTTCIPPTSTLEVTTRLNLASIIPMYFFMLFQIICRALRNKCFTCFLILYICNLFIFCSCFVSFSINRLIGVALVPSFSLVYHTPLYECATIYPISCWRTFIF